MTFREAIRRANAMTADDKIMVLLDDVASSDGGCFHTSQPGPTFERQDGRRMRYESWEQWDAALERGWIEVVDVGEDGALVGLTWPGRKALNKWQKKNRRG